MAAYPSYGILLDSKITAESKWRDDFADSGSQHSRQLRSSEYVQFKVLHVMTLTEFRALKTTLDAGERDDYTLTYFNESPAVTYTVKPTGPAQVKKNLKGSLLLVEVPVRGTKD